MNNGGIGRGYLRFVTFIIYHSAFIICLAGPQPIGHAADVTQLTDRLPRRQPLDDVHQRALAHAEDQQIGLGVQEDRAADLVTPEIVVGQAAEAGLDAAGDDRHASVRLPRPLAIGQGGPVRPAAGLPAGAIGVVVADLAGGRVVVQHRVHVAGTDGEAEPGPAERPPGVARMPVGLAEDRHAEALGLQHPPQQGHRKARMVDVGVAGDEDHVHGVPAPPSDLGRRHWQWGNRR